MNQLATIAVMRSAANWNIEIEKGLFTDMLNLIWVQTAIDMIASGLFFMLLFSCAWELEPKFDYMLYIYTHMN